MVFAIHAKEGIKQPLTETLTRLKTTQLIETKIMDKKSIMTRLIIKLQKRKKTKTKTKYETNKFAKSKKIHSITIT
jgi:hypothetical protein